MNSETSTRYGSRVRRHGRSRAARDHHARSLRVKVTFCVFLSLTLCSDFVVLTPCPPLVESSPPVPLSLRERGDSMLALSFPLSTFVERGTGGEDNAERRGKGVRTGSGVDERAMHPQ